MAYIGKTPTPAPLTSSDIAADIINSTHIGDTAISGFDALAVEPADTDEFLISDGGVLKRLDASLVGGGGVNEVFFFAYRSASDGQQTIAGDTNTKILLPTELYDTASAFASSKFTVPSGKGGYYYLQGKLRDDFNDNYTRQLMIYKNGSNLIQSREYSNGTTRHYTHVSGVFNLSASDYIELYCYHGNSGINRGIDGTNELETSLMGFKLIT